MAEAEPVGVYQVRRPNQWDEEWAYATTKQLKEIDSKCNLTLVQLKKVLDAIAGLTPNPDTVTPELEKAMKATSTISAGIDRKVPDSRRKPVKKKINKQRKK